MVSKKIQGFLEVELKNNNLSRKELVIRSGVSYPVIASLLLAGKPNPNIKTIVKLVDTFNKPIDDALGTSNRNSNVKSFIKLTPDELTSNLRSFLINNMKFNNIQPTKLSRMCGMSATAISEFTTTPYKKNSMGVASLVKISNYLDVSIDEMIGRTPPSQAKEISQPKKPSIAGIVNKADLASLKSIKDSMKGIALKPSSSNSKIPIPTVIAKNYKKDTGHSR